MGKIFQSYVCMFEHIRAGDYGKLVEFEEEDIKEGWKRLRNF